MKYKVAFVCTGNSCRSQMAEGFARALGSKYIEACSAGTHPAEVVSPNAIAVMKELGIDISEQKPKLLSDLPEGIDIIVTMGCGVECPYLPAWHREDWGLDDPVGKPIGEFRKVRDIIKDKLKDLIRRNESGQLMR